MKKYKFSKSVLLLSVFLISIMAMGTDATMFAKAAEPLEIPIPEASQVPLLSEGSIEDTLGQTVKEEKILDLGRDVTIPLIQPIQWRLDIFDFEVLSANIEVERRSANKNIGFIIVSKFLKETSIVFY